MTLEELEALPVGSKIHEAVPSRGPEAYSKYVKNCRGTWDVYDSDNPYFELFRALGQIGATTSEDFADHELGVHVSIISAEEAAA